MSSMTATMGNTAVTWNTGLFGQSELFSESGKRVGESWNSGLFGQKEHFDGSREKIGETWDGFFGTKETFFNDKSE